MSDRIERPSDVHERMRAVVEADEWDWLAVATCLCEVVQVCAQHEGRDWTEAAASALSYVARKLEARGKTAQAAVINALQIEGIRMRRSEAEEFLRSDPVARLRWQQRHTLPPETFYSPIRTTGRPLPDTYGPSLADTVMDPWTSPRSTMPGEEGDL